MRSLRRRAASMPGCGRIITRRFSGRLPGKGRKNDVRGEAFKRKYALTDRGVENTKKGTFWTVIVNLVVMGGVSILWLLMSGFMGTLTEGRALPGAAPMMGMVCPLCPFVLCDPSAAVHRPTYGLVYGEVRDTRIRLAEQLRRAAAGVFWKKGSGGPDGNHHGRREPHGTRVVPCAGLSLWLLHFHGHHCSLPGCL